MFQLGWNIPLRYEKIVYLDDRCTPVLAIGDQYGDDPTHNIVIIIFI